MKKRNQKRPVIGCAFDPDQRNESENIAAYIHELRYYRPRGFSGLVVDVTDHVNMTASMFSRGRKTRELFSIV